jgi:hypothetical protein
VLLAAVLDAYPEIVYRVAADDDRLKGNRAGPLPASVLTRWLGPCLFMGR